VLAGVTPDSLLAQLAPALRPGSVSFYYDPYTEGQKLQQAALQQTGQASFVSGLAWDSQNQPASGCRPPRDIHRFPTLRHS